MWAFTAHRVPHHAADMVVRRPFAKPQCGLRREPMSEILAEIKAANSDRLSMCSPGNAGSRLR
jgi:hypothetical protein